MKKCEYCQIEISSKNPNHIYPCARDHKIVKSKLEIKKDNLHFNYPDLNDYKKIYTEYVENLSSLPDMKLKYNISYHDFLFLLNYYNIPARSIKESSNLISVNKYKKTCMQRYGFENVSQTNDIKEKKKNTFMKNYGVDNIWKHPEYYLRLKEIMISKYGKGSVPNNNNNADSWGWKKCIHDGLKDERIEKLHSKLKNNFISKIENIISDILNHLQISHIRQFNIKGKFYDILIEDLKIIIEVNGDFWHANPKKYKAGEKINIPKKGYIPVEDIWEKDKIKKELAEQNGFKIMYIWESEINNNTTQQIIECLENKFLNI